ncbi:hypothetical protein [Pseudomonas kitaguniensis]|uniref:hypothetical protein n=1 Tax=Pseudomonas kitaguniensis TaxID=2607908 RepID=UPI003D056374
MEISTLLSGKVAIVTGGGRGAGLATVKLSAEQLQRNVEMGSIAYLRTMQACYPHLKASGEGKFINFASLAGVTACMDMSFKTWQMKRYVP